MSQEENEFTDFISFYDDDDTKRELWVKIIEIKPLVTFKIKSGKTISIPHHRILKVKRDEVKE